MENPTGESADGVLRLDFDRKVTLQFRGSVVTTDAGLLAYRELDDALGLTVMAGEMLADARTGKTGRHALVGLQNFLNPAMTAYWYSRFAFRNEGSRARSVFGARPTASTTESERDRVEGPSHLSICANSLSLSTTVPVSANAMRSCTVCGVGPNPQCDSI